MTIELSDEMQMRIFGYVDPRPPQPGSWKAEVYKVVASGKLSDEQIETLAESARRIQERIEAHIINPIIERGG